MFNVLIASGKTKPQRPVGGALVSTLLHASIVTALVLGGKPAVQAAQDIEERMAAFFFPKDRAPKLGDESIATLRIPGGGSGAAAAEGDHGAGKDKSAELKPKDPTQLQIEKPEPGTAAAPNTVQEQVKMAESLGAFALLDVDSAAVRDPNSAAPEYPAAMEAAGVAGLVKVRFVVDSTGLVDMSTVKILETTNDAFARAVRDAMPKMHFRPAMMGPRAVRQLSEQDFKFTVTTKAAATVPPKKKPAQPS